MSTIASATPIPEQIERRTPAGLALLPVLFLGSGCAALIYEVVWYQMLQLSLGSTTISMAFLLASFMGGLAIGSMVVGSRPFAAATRGLHPLRLYAYIEVGIAIFGLLALLGMPLLDRLYIAAAGYGMPSLILRALLAGICLLPPTILMGASLPAAARWIRSGAAGEAIGPFWWGLLYGANTLGAVVGCLAAGFYLLRLYNVSIATYAAILINILVAAVSLLLAGRTPMMVDIDTDAHQNQSADIHALRPDAKLGPTTIYWTIALSGASALGAEVVWTRLLGMLLGSTTYVFSIILAVFLIGLGIGSTAGSWLARTVRPRMALGWSQVLLTGAIFWSAYMIANSLPYWPVNPFLATSPVFTFQIDMARVLWAILPPTLLWGASFPLALAALAEIRNDSDAGRTVGAIYAANTLGSIAGALGVSLILVPWLGTQDAQRVMLAMAALSAAICLLPYLTRQQSKSIGVLLVVLAAAATFFIRNLDAVTGEFISYGRQLPTSLGKSDILYTAEGINSSVAISRWPDGTVYINVNGHVEATTEPYDMALQRMVGHLPGILHPDPKSVLGIGFGAGVSAGTFTRYPGIEKITICEIEPEIPPASTRYFAEQNYEVAKDPRTTIVFDDARHFMMTTTQKFDIIASDPLDVFAKGTAALYSKEYFEAVKAHLNPGGFFTLYVPLYESDVETVRSELATFFDVFPNATVWANTRNGEGYDMVFMGQADPLTINVDEVQARLDRPDYAPVLDSLEEIGFYSATDLFSTYTGRKQDLGPWFADAEITRDDNLRLMYMAGWGINTYQADPIYRQMLSYRQPPEGLFTGSPDIVRGLMRRLALPY